MKIHCKIEMKWGDSEVSYSELEFDKEELESMENKVMIDRWFIPTIHATLCQVKDRILGRNWFMREKGKSLNIPSLRDAV